MKKMSKMVMSLIMVCLVLFSVVAPVSAATVSKVTYSTTNKGGNKATVFYVNAKNKNTTKMWCSFDSMLFLDYSRPAFLSS